MASSATKNDQSEKWIFAFVGWSFWVGYFLVPTLGWGIFGSVELILAVSFLIAFSVAVRVKEHKRRLLERVPCLHGVEGAKQKPESCRLCIAERESERRRTEQQRVDEQRRQAEEKARKYAEWIKQIRLPEFLRTMPPQDFERLICQLYSRMGYNTELTGCTGDGGIDAYLRKNGQTTILQCKRVKGSVGEPVLRDLYGTMIAEDAGNALVVTTGRVSKQAREWAEDKPIEIIELEMLQSLIREKFSESDVVPEDFSPAVSDTSHCPQCGSRLRLIKGRYGKFWGCTAFPNCRFTRDRKKSQRRT
jgi:hypothetical protein